MLAWLPGFTESSLIRCCCCCCRGPCTAARLRRCCRPFSCRTGPRTNRCLSSGRGTACTAEEGKARLARCVRSTARRERSRSNLFALEEALLVTVGDVERQRHDAGRVLHVLNDVVQPSPAGTLHTDTHTHGCKTLDGDQRSGGNPWPLTNSCSSLSGPSKSLLRVGSRLATWFLRSLACCWAQAFWLLM